MFRSKHSFVAVASVSVLLGAAGVTLAAAPASTDSSASLGAAIGDTAITTKVKAKFATDARLKNSDISVETNNGVVTLTGTASSSGAKEAAETLASNVSGVKTVNNQLTAPSATSELGSKARHASEKTASAVEDTAITADLKTKFAADGKTKGADISVTTKDAIVALSGRVVSQAQKEHVIYVARHTKGVTQVDSTALTVSAR
ncbi:MAG: BON domain-containing protein [Steroidobacteraceae bacterium]